MPAGWLCQLLSLPFPMQKLLVQWLLWLRALCNMQPLTLLLQLPRKRAAALLPLSSTPRWFLRLRLMSHRPPAPPASPAMGSKVEARTGPQAPSCLQPGQKAKGRKGGSRAGGEIGAGCETRHVDGGRGMVDRPRQNDARGAG